MDYSGKKVLVMGLGLNGGGLETARFLLKRGAIVSVTDLRNEKVLMPSIEQLDAFCGEAGFEKVRYVLGRHEIDDFKNADIVIKNPGVKPDSVFLQAAKHIETDLSLFLSQSPAKLFAVTGSKGKSCTSSALAWILDKAAASGKTYLGGNITVSPLSFIDSLNENDNVVLELSSFQLGDLKGKTKTDGSPLLKPAAAIITSIMADHLDRYSSMNEYIDDKRNIYRGQDSSCVTAAGDDDWGKSFLVETKARRLTYSRCVLPRGKSGGWLEGGTGFARLYDWEGVNDKIAELVPRRLLVSGEHQKMNLLSAALVSYALGAKAEKISGALETFPGVEHRLEFFYEVKGMRFYNDSAATIPEAAAACVKTLAASAPLILVTGGTDKNLDFTPLVKAAGEAKDIILLAGTGSEKLIPMFEKNGISYNGPFDDLNKAVLCAMEKAESVKSAENFCNIALSPGCASFGMFLNEFDRGNKWKEAVRKLF